MVSFNVEFYLVTSMYVLWFVFSGSHFTLRPDGFYSSIFGH